MFTEYDEIIDNPNKAKAFQLLMYAYLYLKMHPQYIDINVVAGIFSFKNLKSGLIKVSKKISSKEKKVIKLIDLDQLLLIFLKNCLPLKKLISLIYKKVPE